MGCLCALLIAAPLAAPSSASEPPTSILHTDGHELDGGPLGPYEVDAYAEWSPDEWDGAVFTQDQPDLTDHPTVHPVYVVPADAPSRFQQFAAMFQADARQASDRLGELYGRGVRFDERAGADGERYIDISVLYSRHTTAELALPYQQFWAIQAELRSAGFHDPDKKYAVWLDAPSFACGQASLSGDTRRGPENGNESSSIAIVYRNDRRSPGGSTGDAEGGNFCRGRVLLHELGHAFGALQDPAPNNFDGAHCYDSAEDVMCYRPPAIEDTGGPAFDYGNDDYWDPAANPSLGSEDKLPWWTASLSRFVCPTTGCEHPNSDPGY